MFANAQPAAVGDNTLTILIWSLYCGVILSVLYSTFQKRIIGAFVRRLIKIGAKTEETAKTLSELDYKYIFPILLSLRGSAPLRKVVRIVGEVLDTEEEVSSEVEPPKQSLKNQKKAKKQIKYDKNSIKDLRFYLPQSNIDRAESIYGKTDINPTIIIIAAVLFLVVAIACFAVIPKLIQMIQTFLNNLKA